MVTRNNTTGDEMAGQTNSPRRRGVTIALLSGLSALGCRSSEQERLDSTEAPAQHAVFSDELRLAMRDLEAVEQDLPPALDPAAVERQRLGKFVELLRGMAASAEQIPQVLTDVELPADRRAEFEALAGQLRDRSCALADEAPALSKPRIAERVEGIRAICLACHTRFRVLPAIRRP